MAKRKRPQKHQRKAQTKKLHEPKKNRNTVEVELSQIKYFLNEITKRLQGVMFGFDNYVKMKGDDEKLNEYIKNTIEQRKNKIKEKSDAKPVRNNPEDSK